MTSESTRTIKNTALLYKKGNNQQNNFSENKKIFTTPTGDQKRAIFVAL